MRQRFGSLSIEWTEDGEAAEVEPIAEPLFRFSDAAREFHDGTVWAWGREGRPAALAAVELYERYCSFELISLAEGDQRVSVVTAGGWKWSPQKAGLEFHAFPKDPKPAPSATGRLRQMKRFAEAFEVEEVLVVNDERYKLRLLPRPIHRYSKPAAGLHDGALFVYAAGTNLEALLVVECVEDQEDKQAEQAVLEWRYAFAPLTSAAASARLDGLLVWEKQRGPQGTKTQDPYAVVREPRSEPSEGR